MIQETSRQAAEFFWSGMLGLGLGILYDMGRAVRRELPRLTIPVDLLFALIFFLSLWLTSIYTWGLRLYQCLGIFLGGSIYFLTLSPLLLRGFRRILRGIRRLLGKMALPLKKSVYFLRKLIKKFFPSSGKWGTIKALPFSLRQQKAREARENGETTYQPRQTPGRTAGRIRRSRNVPHSGGPLRRKKARRGAQPDLSGHRR